MIRGVLQAIAAVLETHGADPGRFLSIMTESLFSAPVYRSYSALIREQARVVPSKLGMVVKDNGSLNCAQETVVQLRMAEAVRDILTQAAASGEGQNWSSALTLVPA